MGSEIRDYRDLAAWQAAIQLVTAVYTVTQAWPKEELYGLTSQIRRAAVSIPSNIAEGQGRMSTKEFIHHLSIARGSLREVETQLVIARNLRFLASADLDRIAQQASAVSRPLNGLIRSLTPAGGQDQPGLQNK